MNRKINTMFLMQSYFDAKEYLRNSIRGEKYDAWDYIVITASNDDQKKNYELQIQNRLQARLIDPRPRYLIVSDFNGERIGSGGATINALAVLQKLYNINFLKSKVLLIHSGGDSKRIPQYSVCGKLFSPIPRLLSQGSGSTLFDEIITMTSLIPSRMNDGILSMSGDVLVLFNPLQLDFKSGGAVAVSIKKEVGIGKNHGVFLLDQMGNAMEFLHKKDEQELREKNAVDEFGKVNIDTGLVFFDGKIVRKLFSLVTSNEIVDQNKLTAHINSKVRLNFYGDFLYPLSKNATFENYLSETSENGICPELLNTRSVIWDLLKDETLKVTSVSPAEFLHFGTTTEQLKLMTKEISKYYYLGWHPQVLTNSVQSSLTAYHSLETNSLFGSGCYIEYSSLQNCTVGANSILSFVEAEGKTVPSSVVMSGLKLRNGKYVVRIFGTVDDPKTNIDRTCFLGINLKQTFDTFFPEIKVFNETETLWDVKLFPEEDDLSSAFESALKVYRLFALKETDLFGFWFSKSKVSLHSSFQDADVNWVTYWENFLRKKIIVGKAVDILRTKGSFLDIKNLFEDENLKDYEQDILDALSDDDAMARIRLMHFIAKTESILANSLQYENKAYSEISKSCGVSSDAKHKQRAPIRANYSCVELPARVNWGGGWTDTPPYCIENGGTVLNCAVKINGINPIRALCEKIDENAFILESLDSGTQLSFQSKKEILNCSDPFDPVALQKTCLIETGLVTPGDQENLNNVFDALGGGLKLSTAVIGIPRGSGLGTSSILAAATVRSIYDFIGKTYREEDISDCVLRIEQRMSTGGGWQDQIGGLFQGAKLISSNPGKQKPKVTRLSISENTAKELNERYVLIYSGQRRLARNLLRQIIGKYLDGDKDTILALKQIENLALIMKRELERGNIDMFASLLSEHWNYSKLLDHEATNTCIDYIFNVCDDFVSGRMICGAGGGGFLQAILKKGAAKEELQTKLTSVFGDSGVRIWNSELML